MTDKKFEELLKKSGEIAPRAELKDEILSKTKQEMSAVNKETKKPHRISLRKIMAPIAACLVLVIIASGVLTWFIGENYQTVYIDVNPSVSLEINRFGKVSAVNYVNTDAEIALKGVKLKGKGAEDALERIIIAYDNAGYFSEDAELYISAVEKNKKTEKLLNKLAKHAEEIKGSKKYSVNVSKLTKEEKEDAKEHGISPGKYKVISAIIESNPKYTVDELRDKSMAELKELLPEESNKNDKNDKNDKNNKK